MSCARKVALFPTSPWHTMSSFNALFKRHLHFYLNTDLGLKSEFLPSTRKDTTTEPDWQIKKACVLSSDNLHYKQFFTKWRYGSADLELNICSGSAVCLVKMSIQISTVGLTLVFPYPGRSTAATWWPSAASVAIVGTWQGYNQKTDTMWWPSATCVR